MRLSILKRLLGSGYSPFSRFWRGIVQTRLFLCLLIALFCLLDPSVAEKGQVLVYIFFYVAFNLLLGLVSADTLQRNFVRVIPSVVDIFFISLVTYLTGGANNSWFLIYLFPIISVSKYMGHRGSWLLAGVAAAAYLFLHVYVMPDSTLDAFSLALRCLMFFGVAAVAGNLARSRQVEEKNLLDAFEEINHAMLSGMDRNALFRLILKKGLEVTGSEMGHINLVNRKTGEMENAAAIGQAKSKSEWIRSLSRGYSDRVIRSKEPLIISDINRLLLGKRMGTYLRLYVPRPRSALFLPLVHGETVLGVIAVFSRNRFHYRKMDLKRLRSFGSLIAMARKNADLYLELQERLKLLHQIGAQLTAGQNLPDLFNEVVRLTMNQLDSEEAALFVPESQNSGKLVKAAVCGPSEEVTRALGTVEQSYPSGASYVGRIFKERRVIFSNAIPEDVEYVSDYQRAMPSGEIRHYIGVPLFIGDETLGVIRVINKRAGDYSVRHARLALSREGFSDEDMQLMQTIASQVSVAIKNASLRETEKLATLGKLAHTAGHEIKTQIATAQNYVAVLSLGYYDGDEAERLKLYSFIRDALKTSIDKLQNLLMATQPKPPEMSVTRMEDIFLGLEEHMARQAGSQRIEFSIEYPAAAHQLMTDLAQMRQVLSNLFDNSVHAIEKVRKPLSAGAGRITVSGRIEDGCLHIRWADNGCGIPPEDAAKVFLPFYTNKSSGNGLGLFIAKTIVENHGGSLSVTSAEGVGTEFDIRLPLHVAAAGRNVAEARETV
jgi:signal transduction histidine kinase